MANFKRRFATQYEIQNSDDTEVWVAQEATPGTLPAAASQYWREVEANSFSDFGTQLTTAARTYFNPARVEGKPRVIREEAMCGWQADITDDQFPRFAVGFLFHDERAVGVNPLTQPEVKGSKPDTHSIFRDAPVPVTGIDNSASTISIVNTPASLKTRAFVVGDIIKIIDRNNGPNNGKILTLTTGTNGTTLKVAATSLEAQTGGYGSVRVVCIGRVLPDGKVAAAVSGGKAVLNLDASTTPNFSTIGLQAGETIVIGGDVATSRFTEAVNGFATIESVSDNQIVFSDATFTPGSGTKTGRTIQIYFGDYISNGNTRRTYTVARTLGEGLDSSDVAQKQGEFVKGALPNECTINFQPDSFLNTDFSFMPLIAEEFDFDTKAPFNATGVLDANKYRRRGLEGYSAQSDIYRAKLAVQGSAPDDNLFSWIESATITLSNNVTGTTALGVPGYIAQNARKFTATGTLDVLFETVKSTTQIRENSSCYLNIITVAVDTRHGVVYDIPNLTLAGGITVEQGEDIKQNLELTAFGSPAGLAASITAMQHVPEFVDNI